MAFVNRIRLPFYLTRPQFPDERNIFRRADGTTKTLSAVVRKTYEGETDQLPEKIHERLKIALLHDTVIIEGDKYIGGVSMDGDYTIDWQRFLDFPMAKAEFRIQVTPFDFSNGNCQTCEQASQLSLVDDTFPDPLDEDTEYTINVFANDDICCSPITAEITVINADFLESAEIDAASGIVTVVTKTPLEIANGVNLLTYRVTCPNGGYDEADVFGDINGSIEACLAPVNLVISDIASDGATATWEAPDPAPSNGYFWQVFSPEPFSQVVASGTTNDLSVIITGLEPGVEYSLFLQSDCGDESSNFIEETFTTSVSSTACGKYRVFYNDGTGERGNFTEIIWMNCNGVEQTFNLGNLASIIICALEDSPGDPVYISGATTVTYLEPC
jgi:hypothetical protein